MASVSQKPNNQHPQLPNTYFHGQTVEISYNVWFTCSMPSRNRVKQYVENGFYHVYNRGISKQSIFLDHDDYAVFLNLLKRHLDTEPHTDNKKRELIWLHPDLEMLAYCLMPNHFHLLVYQKTPEAMSILIKLITMSYSSYFNKKYGRLGPLFQGTYKAVLIQRDDYLQHISRYIHLNPRAYKTYQYSSLPYYLGKQSAAWIRPKRIIELFDSTDEYMGFLDDYADYKRVLDDLKLELADH